MQHLLRRVVSLSLLVLLSGLLLPAQPAAAANFVVTNTNLTGAGSLAQAITDANNSPGADTITFNISSAAQPGGYWRIQINDANPLPVLSDNGTTIDGFSQPGGRGDGGPKIEISGPANSGIGPSGLFIQSANNVVRGLIINTFRQAGIEINGPNATGNQIYGNYIGTNGEGTAGLGNAYAGVWINNGADNNIIGGVGVGLRNVISGNGTSDNRPQVFIGISATPTAANELSGNQVVGNYIGTNASGTGAIPGASHGVLLGINAIDNTVGPGNVISGNVPNGTPQIQPFGVVIDGEYTPGRDVSTIRNVVKGNIIGLNAAGTSALPNGKLISAQTGAGGGVRLRSAGRNLIGGTAAGDGNVISGHNAALQYGVLIDLQCTAAAQSAANEVQGNIIGLNSAGTAAVPNQQGIRVARNVELPGSTITGPCNQVIGPGNTISGNQTDGIRIVGIQDASDDRQTRAISVRGNRIGTNPAGTAAIPNGASGIWVAGGTLNNVIGGTGANDGNTISANTTYGVLIETPENFAQNETNSPNGTLVQRNRIGTTSDGNSALGNAQGGVVIQRGAHDNTLDGNLVSGHSGTTAVGVLIQGNGTNNNRLYGNIVGANAANTGAISNRLGVAVIDAATNNDIGVSGQAVNIIAANINSGVALTNVSNNRITNNYASFNGSHGVLLTGGSGNRISATFTAQNGGNGISLANNANGNRAAPNFTGLNNNALVGNAPGCANCTIELFTNDVAPPSEVGEGNIYLPLPSPVTTDGAGNFSIPLPVAGCKPYLIVTVTDPANNTSPFSAPFGPVAACQPAAPDITLTAANPSAVSTNPDTQVNYLHTLTNTGNAQATVTISLSSTQGWAQLDPATTTYTLGPGESRDITVRVNVPGNAAGGTIDVSTITASIPGKSVSQTDTTTVNQVFSFLFEPPTRFGTVLPGNFIDYTHYITNTGNGTDTFDLSEVNPTAGQGVTVSFPTCDPCTIGAGQSRAVTVRVTVDQISTASSYVATIRATSLGGGSKDVVDTTQIQQIPVPVLDSLALNGAGKPGTNVTYTHTLRNAGGLAGTFSVNATLPANAVNDGWSVQVTPNTTFNLTPGGTQNVTVVVSIPDYTPGRTTTYSGTQILATVTASAGVGNPTSTANDTTTVLLGADLEFTPDNTSTGAPNQVVQYLHTITNTGNGRERFDLTTAPPAGWSAVVLDAATEQPITSVTLERGASRTIIVQVTIAPGTPVDGVTTTTATAASDSSVAASVIDTTTIVSAAVPLLSPGQTRNTDPGEAISFTHTITNVGNAPALTTPFSITVGVPAGWPAATITPSSIPLDVGAQTTFVVTVTPPANTLAGTYPIRVRATATDANGATAAVIDTIIVNQKAELIFTPSYNDLRDPNTVVTYTHTLTNSGNFTDTIGLAVSASQPWAVTVAPLQTTLAPGASQQVTVTLSIPPGIVAGLVNTTLVTATSSLPPARAVVTNTATIRAVPGLRLTPPLILLAGEAGEPVTFTYKLLNTGSVPQEYTLDATPPTGWTATPLPITVPTLQPGQEVDVRVVVTAPEGTPRNTEENTLLRATSSVASPDTGTPPSATVIARLRVGPAYQFVIEPDQTASARPGQIIQYSHLLTNTGLLSDTIVLSVQSLLGWEVSVTPSSVTLPAGATVPVTVTVQVPTSAEATYVDVATVTGRSTSQGDVRESAIDTTSVLRVAGVNISPRQSAVANPNDVIEFQHRIFNIGNSADAFTLSYTAPTGWEVTLVQTRTIELLPGFSYPVQVRVRVPSNLATNARANITVRATSVFDPSVYDEVVNTLGRTGTQTDQPIEYPYRVFIAHVRKAPAE